MNQTAKKTLKTNILQNTFEVRFVFIYVNMKLIF